SDTSFARNSHPAYVPRVVGNGSARTNERALASSGLEFLPQPRRSHSKRASSALEDDVTATSRESFIRGARKDRNDERLPQKTARCAKLRAKSRAFEIRCRNSK